MKAHYDLEVRMQDGTIHRMTIRPNPTPYQILKQVSKMGLPSDQVIRATVRDGLYRETVRFGQGS